MKFKYSTASITKLSGVHPHLIKVFGEVIKHADCTILEGVRSEERQRSLVQSGKSRIMISKHMVQEDGYGHAVDAIASPIDWDDRIRNTLFAGFVKGIASAMGIEIRIGADWDGDFQHNDQKFHDLVHFELLTPPESV